MFESLLSVLLGVSLGVEVLGHIKPLQHLKKGTWLDPHQSQKREHTAVQGQGETSLLLSGKGCSTLWLKRS